MTEHYNKVGRYIEELKRTNKHSMFKLKTELSRQQADKHVPNSIPVFQRMFACFDGLGKGLLEAFRPVLCIDANFLKTFLGGVLMAAVAVDGNNQMYPIAWAVTEGENINS